MTTELQQIQAQLSEALSRIERLEEAQRWKHLIARPDSWRRQLSLRDRNMTVGQLVSTVYASRMTPDQAAEDLDLPLEVIREALAYYEQNKELVQREAEEERRWLRDQGFLREPENLSR